MWSSFGMLGSVDSNTGSPDLGWDTDQFPMDTKNTTLVMKVRQAIGLRGLTQSSRMLIRSQCGPVVFGG